MNRDISAAECGENRLTLCVPGKLSVQPFAAASYLALLQAEDARLISMKRCIGEDGAVTPSGFAARKLNEGHGWHAAIAWQVFQTRRERWTLAGWQDADSPTKNDERVLFRGKMQMRVALIEVHRVRRTADRRSWIDPRRCR